MNLNPIKEVEAKANAAKAAASKLATASTELKNAALLAMVDELEARKAEIFDANARDLSAARDKGIRSNMIDRLTITEKRLRDMQEGLRQVAVLRDPVGEVLSGFRRPNGLQVTKVRVPIGVIGIIYEARPNVTVDAAALTVKSGNAVVLRGGSEALYTNIALTDALQAALTTAGLPPASVSLVETADREAARHLMTLNGVIDCLIPRGGASLIRTVLETATVPVIETGTGNCHVYLDRDADPKKAISILLNAKTQRTSVCNAAESMLIHRDVVNLLLPVAGQELRDKGVEIRGDADVCAALPYAVPATDADWYEEYNDLIISAKVVESVEEAVAHINKYGTHHSDAIVTEDYAAAQTFTDGVDSAAVYVNASTRFTDGFEFGFGAEIGISNQKLHARGPMGLEELTTYKYIIRGNGQVRA
ncbi:MAG TPA: glutamate-5-semialdehyde dehydrogenase [Capsulimonadaceae bacterium]|jgi:glutamate-5-semialdehyde dehydrogenase